MCGFVGLLHDWTVTQTRISKLKVSCWYYMCFSRAVPARASVCMTCLFSVVHSEINK